MKDHPLSVNEREFILKAIEERKRLDGRGIYDQRKINIDFGHDRGHVEVTLGDTRVECQVSAEVVKPPGGRPTEGVLFFNVELSPMAAASFEPGRSSPQAVQLSRFLEHAIKDSRAVDTESLCIVADEKVWSIRVDVHVLDYGGGLATACSLAAILGLSHFRRADVSVVGEEVTIHSVMKRDPVPLTIYHMPICVAIGFFHAGKYLIVDPTWAEERVMDGALTIGMNVHHEVCLLSTSGTIPLTADQIQRCTQITATKVAEMTELAKKALAASSTDKKKTERANVKSRLTTVQEKREVAIPPRKEEDVMALKQARSIAAAECKDTPVNVLGRGTAELGLGGASAWSDDEESPAAPAVAASEQKQPSKKSKKRKKAAAAATANGDGSDEETTTILSSAKFKK